MHNFSLVSVCTLIISLFRFPMLFYSSVLASSCGDFLVLHSCFIHLKGEGSKELFLLLFSSMTAFAYVGSPLLWFSCLLLTGFYFHVLCSLVVAYRWACGLVFASRFSDVWWDSYKFCCPLPEVCWENLLCRASQAYYALSSLFLCFSSVF